jgi:hypothetical protein
MYYETNVREATGNEVKRSDNEELIPSHFAFIEMPTSHGSRVFPNLILFHEIGHFAFKNLASNVSLIRLKQAIFRHRLRDPA